MPSITKNYLLIHKDDLHLIVNDQGQVDFGILRPMPKSLDVGQISPRTRTLALKAYRGEIASLDSGTSQSSNRLRYTVGETGEERVIDAPTLDDYKELGRILSTNLDLHDATDWQSWRVQEFGWGTEQNAQETEMSVQDDNWILLSFQTIDYAPSSSFLLELRYTCEHLMNYESVSEDDGYTIVYNDDGEEIPDDEVFLFEAFYYNEGGEQITEEQFSQLEEGGEDCYMEYA